jgi:hypothetical protein
MKVLVGKINSGKNFYHSIRKLSLSETLKGQQAYTSCFIWLFNVVSFTEEKCMRYNCFKKKYCGKHRMAHEMIQYLI